MRIESVGKFITIWTMCALLQSCASLSQDGTVAQIGKPAPDVTFTMLDGLQYKLADFKGDVIVVDFWATWCPPCQKSLPELDKMAKDRKLAAQGLKIVAVDLREDQKVITDYLAKNGLSLLVALDGNGGIAQDFQVRGLPATVIIGRDGTIRNVLIPVDNTINEADLTSAIAKALAN